MKSLKNNLRNIVVAAYTTAQVLTWTAAPIALSTACTPTGPERDSKYTPDRKDDTSSSNNNGESSDEDSNQESSTEEETAKVDSESEATDIMYEVLKEHYGADNVIRESKQVIYQKSSGGNIKVLYKIKINPDPVKRWTPISPEVKATLDSEVSTLMREGKYEISYKSGETEEEAYKSDIESKINPGE